MNRKSSPSTGTEIETQTETQTSTSSSLKDLLASGTAKKCTFSSTQSGTASEGTVYVSGGRVRGDFKTTASGQAPMTMSMITDGKTIHMWGDQLGKQGIKITVDEKATTPAAGGGSPTDLNSPVNMNCSAWIVQSSMFDLPAGVTFTEGFTPPTM